MKKYFSFALLVILLGGCGKSESVSAIDTSDSEDLIIGGHTITKKNELSSTTVSLLDTQAGTLCTATILSENIVVSAAHCVEGNPNFMEISFGPRSLGKEIRPVVDVAISKQWALHQNDRKNTGDISLIKFSGGLPKGFHPATILGKAHKLVSGEVVTLAGFGIINGNGAGAGRLRTVEVKIEDAQFSNTEVMLDQTSGKGACHGDSGGPAFIQDNNGGLLLWGVTSRGINDPSDQCTGNSIYTKILPYSRWINTIARAWSP